MGNSPSSSKSNKKVVKSSTISKPSGRSRRASLQGPAPPDSVVSNNMLVAPPPRHRRSRSTNSTRIPEPLPPPPPYSATAPSVAIDSPPENSPIVPPKPPVALRGNARTGTGSGSRYTTVSTTHALPSSGRAARTNTYLRAPMRQQTKEDALETLKKFNTVLIIDDSSSMQGTLWTEATTALAALADLAGQYDTDGIDIHFLNDPNVGSNMKNAAEVQNLFEKVRPRGITPIGEKLEDLLRTYLYQIETANATGDPAELKGIKPVNYIVITDGAPTDDPESVIVQAAKRLDAGNFPITQVGIQFVQIGKSRRAAKYLQELDDGLSVTHEIRDIVDTTPYIGRLNGDALIKILLGGINRRVDTLGAEAVV